MSVGNGEQRIENYLRKLRALLRGINDQDVVEIVEELRRHILEKSTVNGEITTAGIEAALAQVGSPEELASQCIVDNLLARAEASRSPLLILDSLFRWASLSVAGFLVLLASVVGYFFGAVLLLCGLLKPFHSQTAGLWVYRGSAGELVSSLRLGFGTPPPGGRDLLGWWIVPIGLIAGAALVILTTRFALWCTKQYRRSRSFRAV